MNEIYVSIAGRVVADPEARSTRTGVPFTAFRMASTVRRQNPQTREFEDAATSFVNVTAFRSLGLNAASSLRRGDPVLVHGRMRVNQWMRSDNTPATSVEVDAYSIGHDLSYGTTAFTKVTRAQSDSSDRMSDPEVQSAHRSIDGLDDPDGLDADSDEYEVSDDEAPDLAAPPGEEAALASA